MDKIGELPQVKERELSNLCKDKSWWKMGEGAM